MALLDDVRFDELEIGPDLDVIARQVVEAKRKLRRPAPSVVDLATALTSISITDTITGSSTLTLQMVDPDWELMDSGFFDANADGRLDAIDVNYPDKSRFWWRMTQCNPSAAQTIELVLMERAAVYLMSHRGPVKTSRAKKTRAEFLKGLSDKVKAGGGIRFYSKELHKQQLTQADEGGEAAKSEAKAKKKSDEDRQASKDGGINRDEKLEGKQGKLSKEAIGVAEEMLDEAYRLDAPAVAVVTLMVAGMVEGPDFANPTSGGAGGNYAGPLQYNKATWGIDKARDPTWSTNHFLTKGATGAGGAIEWANKGLTPAEIINKIHNPGGQQFYEGQGLQEKAGKIIEAYGGASSGGTSYRQQYNFEVGSPDNPGETYWDAMNRLAEEVKWALFLDGNRLYFDNEMTLIGQKPAAIIRRDDPAVVDWDYIWDARHIATEMRLDLICDPFQFRAGEVLQLKDFGPASTGSTAKPKKLPGRWLIAEIERDRSSLMSSFTLKQPEAPEREPVSELKERDDADVVGGGDIFEACQKIDKQNRSYSQATSRTIAETRKHPEWPLDCSNSVALALADAGMYDEPTAMVSGEFARRWGKPGRGQDFTVWANAGHVFLQSEGSGRKWRFDTGGGPPGGPHIRDGHRSTSGFTPRHWGESESDSEDK